MLTNHNKSLSKASKYLTETENKCFSLFEEDKSKKWMLWFLLKHYRMRWFSL